MRQAKPHPMPSLVGYKNNAGTVHLDTLTGLRYIAVDMIKSYSHKDTTLNDTHILGREGLTLSSSVATVIRSNKRTRTQTSPNEAMHHEDLCPKHYVSTSEHLDTCTCEDTLTSPKCKTKLQFLRTMVNALIDLVTISNLKVLNQAWGIQVNHV